LNLEPYSRLDTIEKPVPYPRLAIFYAET